MPSACSNVVMPPLVTTGVVNVDGRSYALTPLDFAQTRAGMEHWTQGLSLKQHTGGTWDWEANASIYDYRRDTTRSSALTVPVDVGMSGSRGYSSTGIV